MGIFSNNYPSKHTWILVGFIQGPDYRWGLWIEVQIDFVLIFCIKINLLRKEVVPFVTYHLKISLLRRCVFVPKYELKQIENDVNPRCQCQLQLHVIISLLSGQRLTSEEITVQCLIPWQKFGHYDLLTHEKNCVSTWLNCSTAYVSLVAELFLKKKNPGPRLHSFG